MSTYECQKQRNCPEIVHMTLPEATEMPDVITKQQTRVVTSQQPFHESGIYPVYYSRVCLLLLISYRYLQPLM
jgi:hypothetical protein